MDDDDVELRPPDAYALTQKQVTEELERRKRKGVGFLDDDQRTLQEVRVRHHFALCPTCASSQLKDIDNVSRL